jgi:hypothetical protein
MPSTDFEKNLNKLSRIVKNLRQRWISGISEEDIERAKKDLRSIQKIDFKRDDDGLATQVYEYDNTKFPSIPKDAVFEAPVHKVSKDSGPRNLAEALLWKKGDWSKYVAFVNDFKNKDLNPKTKEGGPVFFAFAKHLKDRKSKPILDQHSARALWVLSDSQWDLKDEPYRHFLLEGKNGVEQWRTSQSPKNAANLVISNFWSSVTSTCAANDICLTRLDALLMPLGQALKHYSRKKNPSSHYEGLIEITGLISAKRCDAPTKS